MKKDLFAMATPVNIFLYEASLSNPSRDVASRVGLGSQGIDDKTTTNKGDRHDDRLAD